MDQFILRSLEKKMESRTMFMKTDDFTRQVLLIEVGTSYTKCGLSGSANPLFVFPYNVFFVFFRNSFIVGSLFQCRETIEGRRVGQCCVWLLYNRLLQVFLVQHCFLQTLFRAMISTVNDKKVIIGHHIYAPVGFLDAVCSVLLKSYRVRSFEEGFDLQ